MCSAEAKKAPPPRTVGNHYLMKSAPIAKGMAHKRKELFVQARVGKRQPSLDPELCIGDDELMRLESVDGTQVAAESVFAEDDNEAEAEVEVEVKGVDAPASSTASLLSPTLPLSSHSDVDVDDDDLLEDNASSVPFANPSFDDADLILASRSRASSRSSTPAFSYSRSPGLTPR